MKISKPHKSRKVIFITVALVAALSAGTFYYLNYVNPSYDKLTSNQPNIDYSEPTDKQVEAGTDIKQRSVENSQNIKDSDKQTKPSLDNNEPIPSTLTTYITATALEDDTLFVRNEITKITEQGSCTLTMTNGSKNVEKTVGIQALAKSSTCKGFNIPRTELANGKWDITIEVETGGEKASAKGQVEV